MDPRIRIHPKMSWIRNTGFIVLWSWQVNVEDSLAVEEDEDDLCSEEEAAHCDTYFSHLKVSR
jgi:hypothetical protein